MPGEDNKALIRRFCKEIDEGNLDAINELVAENYLDHSPPPFPGIGSGREGLKQYSACSGTPRPAGMKSRIKSPKATRPSPGSPPTAYANETFPGSPATGRPVKMTGTAIHRIDARRTSITTYHHRPLGRRKDMARNGEMGDEMTTHGHQRGRSTPGSLGCYRGRTDTT